ncbi:venom protease-like [Tachypleus tridentatus]|uniref:venom protease-like n=1 Tax=Tachypleus tridentatus TaxID=6853 RepID=UPI003FD3B0D5
MMHLSQVGCCCVLLLWVPLSIIISPAHSAAVHVSCGKQMVRSGRIVGGEDAHDGEFPSLVSIRLNGQHFCGGTIIAKRWVLTAGHCVILFAANRFVVRVGEYRLSQDEDHPTQDIPVKQKIIHPSYSKPKKYFNDIALLELTEDIKFNDYAWPACLPLSEESSSYKGQQVTVTGWGWLNEPDKGGERADTLQKVNVPVMDYKHCQSLYHTAGKMVIFQSGQMCAGYKEGKKDSCQGDSGGPLYMNKNNIFTVIGVVSAGIGCGREYLPGLYTEVVFYRSWILEHVDNI